MEITFRTLGRGTLQKQLNRILRFFELNMFNSNTKWKSSFNFITHFILFSKPSSNQTKTKKHTCTYANHSIDLSSFIQDDYVQNYCLLCVCVWFCLLFFCWGIHKIVAEKSVELIGLRRDHRFIVNCTIEYGST